MFLNPLAIRLSMSEFDKFLSQFKFMLVIYSPIILILFAAFLAQTFMHIPVSELTRDPAAVGNLPFYTGWISSLGIVLWAASASIALFASRICEGNFRRYLLSIGLLISMLLIDDLFMLHDGLLPAFGIHEVFVFAVYAIALALIIRYNVKFLLKQDYWILLSAGFFLACSLVVDVKLGHYMSESIENLFEDGFKILGIAGIFGHVLNVSLKGCRKK
jgi:hypothetical protein